MNANVINENIVKPKRKIGTRCQKLIDNVKKEDFTLLNVEHVGNEVCYFEPPVAY